MNALHMVKKQYEDGIITEGERQSKTISIWTEVSDHAFRRALQTDQRSQRWQA